MKKKETHENQQHFLHKNFTVRSLENLKKTYVTFGRNRPYKK